MRWVFINIKKKIDLEIQKRNEIVKNLFLLKEKINYTIFILNRSVNTYELIKKDKKTKEEFLKALNNHEIPSVSKTVNEEIPILNQKIKSSINLNFGNNKKVINAFGDLQKDFNSWTNKLIQGYWKGEYSFSIRPEENDEELNAILLKNQIDELIKIINNF